MTEKQNKPYRNRNRDGYRGQNWGGNRGQPRGGFQGPPRGNFRGQPRGNFNAPQSGYGYGAPQQPLFQSPGGFQGDGLFQGPAHNIPVGAFHTSAGDGILPTPNHGGEQTVREETTTTTYVDGKKVTKTVVTIKEGGSSGPAVQQPTSSQGYQNSGYASQPPPPLMPPHSNPNRYAGPNHNTNYPVPPHMYDNYAPRQSYPANQRPPQPQHFRGRPRGGSYNKHGPPPPNEDHRRGESSRDRNANRENRGGNRRSGSMDRRWHQQNTMGRSVSLLDIAIDDDAVEKKRADCSSESDQDSDGSTSQTVSKGKQKDTKDKNRNKKKNRQKRKQIDDTERKEISTREDDFEKTDDDKTKKAQLQSENKERRNRKQNSKSKENSKPGGTDMEITPNNKPNTNPKQNTSKKERQSEEKEDMKNQPEKRKTSESSDTSGQQFGPNVKDVFDFMVKEMNGKGTPKDIRKKSGLFLDSFDRNMLEEWFKRFSKRFKSIIRHGRVVFVFVYNRDMNYCLDYISRHSCSKDKCMRYHVCKDMLCGHCKFWPSCNKSHDFLDDDNHNARLTRKFGLAKYTNDELLAMMSCRYPHLCHNWNQPNSCKNRHCEKLHLCQNFLLNKCENGDDCPLGHDRASSHNAPIIEAFEMTSWNDVTFRRIIYIQRKDDNDETDDLKEDSKKDVIKTVKGKVDITDTDDEIFLCDQYLLDNCHKANCPLYHNEDLQLPYIWQIKLEGKWTSLSQSEEIEKEYCALAEHSEPSYVNDLDSGESVMVRIVFSPQIRAEILSSDSNTGARRLSTRSYKEKGPINNFRTQWRWYKKSTEGEFEQYDQHKLQHTLEEKYLSGQKEYQFLSENLPYIDLTAMVVCDDGKYTPVLRRPLLVTRDDVEQKKPPPSLPMPVFIPVLVPKGWAKWDSSEKVELVKLQDTSSEYKNVHDQFYSSFNESKRSQWPIKHVFRVQNYTLWDQFCSKESSMKTALQHAGRRISSLDKRYLFHGTDKFAAVKGICRENIDPRVSGKNAIQYGDGAYFAKESFLAHMYTDQASPNHFVFMVNVLVGDFTKGDETYRKPPEKPDTDGEHFDSCVDNVDKPMKFVIFDRTQYYPEFLIWYCENNK